MHVDPLEPANPGPAFDEVTEEHVAMPAHESAWTPTETLNREVYPPAPWWTAWFALMGALGGAAVVLAAVVAALALTS